MNRNKAAELLDAYTKFLLKGGYVDDDVWCEGSVIDKFMQTKWFKENYPFVSVESAFYKNCKQQRKHGAKICQDCPFRDSIELQEKGSTINQGDFHKPRLGKRYNRLCKRS
jgi:hypothetical protein